jgi:hypothetical protein
MHAGVPLFVAKSFHFARCHTANPLDVPHFPQQRARKTRAIYVKKVRILSFGYESSA